MDFNRSWVIDSTWEPTFVDEVKRSHIKIKDHLWSWTYVENAKMASFEKLNQTWFIDTLYYPLYVNAVKGLIRSQIIRGQVVRRVQNVKFTSFES